MWKNQVNVEIKSKTHWDRYVRLIDHAFLRGDVVGYKERHHAWPASHGGSNDRWNIVNLSFREHFLAHWMLWKALRTPQMGHAFGMMKVDQGFGKRVVTSRMFESSRAARVEASKGVGNPMFGKTGEKHPMYGSKGGFFGGKHTEEAKAKLSKLKSGKNNTFYGKTHTEEAKAKMRGRVNPFLGKKHDEEMKKSLSSLALNRPRVCCIYCKKETPINQHKQWHGDNCRDKV